MNAMSEPDDAEEAARIADNEGFALWAFCWARIANLYPRDEVFRADGRAVTVRDAPRDKPVQYHIAQALHDFRERGEVDALKEAARRRCYRCRTESAWEAPPTFREVEGLRKEWWHTHRMDGRITGRCAAPEEWDLIAEKEGRCP